LEGSKGQYDEIFVWILS